MSGTVFLILLIAATLFAVLAVLTLRRVGRANTPGMRTVGWIVGAFYILLMVETTHHMGHMDESAAWVPQRLGVLDWHVIQAAVAIALGLVTFAALRRLGRSVSENQIVVGILMDQIPPDLSIEEIGLTKRELEVSQVIGTGRLSDRDIANALYISEATAATHVRNILGKAGLHRRNDILLLVTRSNHQPKHGSETS